MASDVLIEDMLTRLQRCGEASVAVNLCRRQATPPKATTGVKQRCPGGLKP